MRVKICGISTPEAFDAVVEAGADYVGLVFFARSPRAVTVAQAVALTAGASNGPQRVGLFVAPTVDEVAAVLDCVKLNALQLHDVPDLAPFQRFGLPLWRAVGVRGRQDLPAALAGASELLLDAKAPPGSTRPGGNAVSFDWNLLADWRAPAPWWLAGGLNPANVAHAIRISGAQAVDVSSGVESAPGVKSPAAIKEFVRVARGITAI